MSSVVNDILSSADYFILLVLRVSGLIFSSPIFGRINIPQRVKTTLVVALAFMFFVAFPQSAPIEYTTLIGFVIICAGELLLGIALAFVTNLFFTLTYVAGHIMDTQIGFGMVNVYDPQTRTQSPVLGNLLNTVLLLVFFSVSGHLRLIEIVSLTLERMPVGTLSFSPSIGLVALEVFTRTFMLGIMVAMPIMASGLTLELVFGMLMRAVPQLHMFVVGVPLKLVVGLIVFMSTLPVFSNFTNRIFSEMFLGIEKMFAAFAEAA